MSVSSDGIVVAVFLKKHGQGIRSRQLSCLSCSILVALVVLES